MMTNLIAAQTPPIEPGVSQALAQWRGKHYSDVRYKLNITLEKGAPLMKGDIEIRVNLTDEAAKTYLVLDWRTTQFENDKDKPFADVVSVNESIIKKLPETGEYAYSINKEHIVIAQRLLKSGENVIKIAFASPIKTSGAAITRYVDKEDNAEYIYSLFVPSDVSTAFPVFDQPDLKAKFDLFINAPKGWKAVSNSLVNEYAASTKIGSSTKEEAEKFEKYNATREFFPFFETKPISTYVFAFAVGEFQTFYERSRDEVFNEVGDEHIKKYGGIAIEKIDADVDVRNPRIYVRKSQAEKFKQHSAEVFRLNRDGVK